MPWNHGYLPPNNERLGPELYAMTGWITFITIRAYQDWRPFIRDDLNEHTVRLLCKEADAYGCWVFTYCLMPDHIHFLTSPRTTGISVLRFVDRYKGKSTNRSWSLKWQGKLWQPRFYDHLVRTEDELLKIVGYIRDNAVRKALVGYAEEWPWSGQMHPFPF